MWADGWTETQTEGAEIIGTFLQHLAVKVLKNIEEIFLRYFHSCSFCKFLLQAG
jgi:hypothetical protein